MKKFILYTAGIFMATLALMAVLDFTYTQVYQNAPPRSKFQFLRSLKNKKFDYIFLGSSRAENGIVPYVIEKQTGKTAVNLGFQDSKFTDIFTVLQLLKSYNITFDKVFIQTDFIFNTSGSSKFLEYQIIPFIDDNPVTQRYFATHPDRDALLHVPFYRYCTYDAKLGFRELYANLIGKQNDIVEKKGFSALQGTIFEKPEILPEKVAARNFTYDSIRNYCRENHISAVFYSAPFRKYTKNLDYIQKLKTKIPDLKDYSRVVQNDSLFKDNSHLNQQGAEYFTRHLVTDLGL